MSQKIAVTGATGRVGSHLVEILGQRGHDVVPIARSKGVDVVSGEGLDEALVGVETIIDTATGPSPDEQEATAFFTASARNLQRAGATAGAKRIVVVSTIEIRESRGGPLAEPDDPDAAAYADGAALPNPGAKLAGPSFEEWLAVA